MTLATLLDAELAFGTAPAARPRRLTVWSGERIGLIGRNGTGKSSLLGVIAGTLALDDGELQQRDGLRSRWSSRSPNCPPARRCARACCAARPCRSARTTSASAGASRRGSSNSCIASGSTSEARAPAVRRRDASAPRSRSPSRSSPTCCCSTSRPTTSTSTASSCSRTCSLKVPAAIVITHDRAFLDRVATRIVELDRGAAALVSRQLLRPTRRARPSELAAEDDRANRKFDKFWAQEEVWIRQGIEARRTRNEGRVKRLERLRDERAARRERLGNVKLALDAGERSGKLVAELENVTQVLRRRAPSCAISRLRIMRGDRLGLIGPNGAGKTHADQADPRRSSRPTPAPCASAPTSQVAYFDQLREQLDPEKHGRRDRSARGSDWVEIGGERKHVISYLADFLFPPQRADSPVRMLSGGERNRLLLARLFARPANLLVLDEPTNDLDIESLELLEDDAAGLHRHAAAGEPRPRLPRQRGDADAGGRRRRPLAGIRRAATATGCAAASAPPARDRDPRGAAKPRARARATRAQAELQGAARAREPCPARSRRWSANRAS